jgi:hypothetical protein
MTVWIQIYYNKMLDSLKTVQAARCNSLKTALILFLNAAMFAVDNALVQE